MKVLHPAKYHERVLTVLGRLVREEADALGRRPLVLDPFAGTGRVHELRAWADTTGVEIEPTWAALRKGTIVGNALALPAEWSGRFDLVTTSPTYSNRMADHHEAKDGSTRRSYTHDLRNMTGNPTYTLHPDNTGSLAWGTPYREAEARALAEMWRVLRPGGLLALVLSDYFRTRSIKELVPCLEWHLSLCLARGWLFEGAVPIGTPRYRFGANRDDRATAEVVLQLRRPDAATLPTLYPGEPHHGVYLPPKEDV